MPTSAITLEAIQKRFGPSPAVRDLSLSIARGEMFGLIGPDGAGKTTTIRVICGLLAPDAGSVRVLGLDPVRDHRQLTDSVGYLSQRFSLYGDLSVDENVAFFAEIHGVRDYAGKRDRLLELTQLTPFRTRLAGQLSGGMKQKLSLCCALIHHPEVLLLDEPTFGVDPISRRDLWLILHEMVAEGVTMLVSTSYLDEAERCDRVVLLHDGGVLALDTPDELMKLLPGQVVSITAEQPRTARDVVRGIPGVLGVALFGDVVHAVLDDGPLVRDRVVSELERDGAGFLGLVEVEPSLEDVFLHLVREREEGGVDV